MKRTNAMKGARMVLANGDPITELRFSKGSSRVMDSRTGEFNANSRRDLVENITRLMESISSGEAVEENAVQFDSRELEQHRREVVASAMNNPEEWAALGSNLAVRIEEEVMRQGFLRKVSKENVLRQGEQPRVVMPIHSTHAVVATSNTSVGHQRIRQKVFYPSEFEIVGNVRVENLDIDQVNGDLLDHAYNDGLQAFMVKEDRMWKKAADMSVGKINDLEYISGELTTKNLGNLRHAVAKWNLPVSYAIIDSSYWSDIIGSNDFATMLDPITKYDLALNGQVGTLVGMQLLTDGFRQPNQRVLEAGEIYIVADQEYHATHSTRGGIRSTPTSGANQGENTRGWFFTSPFSFALTNYRSVAKGQRI